MSVGGWLIEVKPMEIPVGEPAQMIPVVRLWCMDRHDTEVCTYAVPAEILPKVGDPVWWTVNTIHFDDDNRQLIKIGFSFNPAGRYRPAGRRASKGAKPA